MYIVEFFLEDIVSETKQSRYILWLGKVLQHFISNYIKSLGLLTKKKHVYLAADPLREGMVISSTRNTFYENPRHSTSCSMYT